MYLWMMAKMLNDITLEDLYLDNVLFSPYPYEQQLVKVIEKDGKQVTLVSASQLEPHLSEGTIKIEGMERISKEVFSKISGYMHKGPVSAHVFIAKKDAPTFPTHTDPDPVILFMLSGQKTIEIEDEVFELKKGQCLFIQEGKPHRAINTHDSIMLSIAHENYMVDKL